MADSTRGSRVAVYAQNMHHAAEGAFTGEVSPRRCSPRSASHGVLLGHSERRELFGETDRALALKVPAALEAGLLPVLCVGETEEERERGDTERKLRHQVQEDLAKVPHRAAGRRRDRLRADLGDRHRARWRRPSRPRRRSPSCARSSPTARARRPTRTRVLYGGSVKPENAAELLALPDVDGALVGGASLDAESFAAIVAAA